METSRSAVPANLVVLFWVGGFAFLSLTAAAQLDSLSEAANAAVTNLLGIIAGLVAAALALTASRSASEGHVRTGWRLIALAMLAWTLGDAIWAGYENVLGVETPYPSVAEIAYLAGYPLLLLAFLHLGGMVGKGRRNRALLDAFTSMLILAIPVWYYIVLPVHQGEQMDLVTRLANNAYPVGDLVLLFGLSTATFRRWRGPAGGVLLALGGGLMLMLIADIVFVYQTQITEYSPGTVLELGWHAGYGLVGLAAYLQWRWRPEYEIDASDEVAPAWRQAIPVALMLPLVAWFAFVAARGDSPPDALSAVLLCVVVVLTLVRSVLGFNEIVGLNASLARANDELQSSHENLQVKSRQVTEMLMEAMDLSRRDSLTGLLNHGAMMTELAQALDGGAPFQIALLDVDSMKAVNDRHGHQAGDAVLIAVAERLNSLSGCVVGRYGGDEFVAITRTRDVSAVGLGSALRMALNALWLPEDLGGEALTVSYGVASFPVDGLEEKALLKAADERLYTFKRARLADLTAG